MRLEDLDVILQGNWMLRKQRNFWSRVCYVIVRLLWGCCEAVVRLLWDCCEATVRPWVPKGRISRTDQQDGSTGRINRTDHQDGSVGRIDCITHHEDTGCSGWRIKTTLRMLKALLWTRIKIYEVEEDQEDYFKGCSIGHIIFQRLICQLKCLVHINL
jgi:hypothetical protein